MNTKHETLETLFRNIDLSFAKTTTDLLPHRWTRQNTQKPNGTFQNLYSHENQRRPQPKRNDQTTRRSSKAQKTMPHQTRPRRLSPKRSEQFIRKVGETRLIKIIEEKVVRLLKGNGSAYVDSIFDASFVKAWSKRDPLDSQTVFVK